MEEDYHWLLLEERVKSAKLELLAERNRFETGLLKARSSFDERMTALAKQLEERQAELKEYEKAHNKEVEETSTGDTVAEQEKEES